jgi:hypothetical protein
VTRGLLTLGVAVTAAQVYGIEKPMCKVVLECEGQTQETKELFGLDPIWEENFTFEVSDPESVGPSLAPKAHSTSLSRRSNQRVELSTGRCPVELQRQTSVSSGVRRVGWEAEAKGSARKSRSQRSATTRYGRRGGRRGLRRLGTWNVGRWGLSK